MRLKSVACQRRPPASFSSTPTSTCVACSGSRFDDPATPRAASRSGNWREAPADTLNVHLGSKRHAPRAHGASARWWTSVDSLARAPSSNDRPEEAARVKFAYAACVAQVAPNASRDAAESVASRSRTQTAGRLRCRPRADRPTAGAAPGRDSQARDCCCGRRADPCATCSRGPDQRRTVVGG